MDKYSHEYKHHHGHHLFQEFLHTSRRLLPVFVIAAFLPVVAYFLGTGSFSLNSQADTTPELRLWFEPTKVLVSSRQPVTLTLMGEYVDSAHFSGEGDVSIVANDPSVNITPTTISTATSFRGRTSLGTVSVTPTRRGDFTITLVPQFDTADINVVTSSASIQTN